LCPELNCSAVDERSWCKEFNSMASHSSFFVYIVVVSAVYGGLLCSGCSIRYTSSLYIDIRSVFDVLPRLAPIGVVPCHVLICIGVCTLCCSACLACMVGVEYSLALGVERWCLLVFCMVVGTVSAGIHGVTIFF
jgi:hypothetical protein